MIHLFILGLTTGILRAWYNYAVWKDNSKLWHKVQGLYIGVMVAGLFYCTQIIDTDFLTIYKPIDIYINVLLLSIFFLTPQWICMDGFYNLFRKLHWFENNPEGESVIDKLSGWKFILQGLLLFIDFVIILNYIL